MAMLISKFHRLIQNKIFWGAFAVLISVAFVGVTVPGAGSRKAARAQQKAANLAGRLYGEDVTRDEFGQAYRSVYFNLMQEFGGVPQSDEIQALITERAWLRIAMLKKAEQMGFINTPEQLVQMIQSQPLFINRQTGQFDPNAYKATLPQIQRLTGMGPQQLEQHFSQELLLRKVQRVPLQSSLVTEEEIVEAFHFLQ